MNNAPFLVCDFKIKEDGIKEDGDEYIIEGYASTYGNIDLVDDIVEQGAFDEDIKDDNVRPILYQHQWDKPIGVGEFKSENHGLFTRIRLPKDSTFVSGEVMPQVKIGSIKAMSIGYSIIDSETDTMNGRRIFRLKKLKLREVSLVTFPANPEARITAAKQYLEHVCATDGITPEKKVPAFKDHSMASTEQKWNSSEAVKRIREYTDSTENPSKTYKDAFFYYDPDNQDKYGSYKLPYCDIVDGKLRAVPRALSAVVGVLRGARGGVDIPAEDKEKIKKQINKYYKKLGREEPFKADGKIFIDHETFNRMEKEHYEIIFDDDIIISNQVKLEVIKAVKSVRFQNTESSHNTANDSKSILEEIKKLKNNIEETING